MFLLLQCVVKARDYQEHAHESGCTCAQKLADCTSRFAHDLHEQFPSAAVELLGLLEAEEDIREVTKIDPRLKLAKGFGLGAKKRH